MTQPIDRETAIALAKEAGMAGMLTDVVCSLEEIHRLCNLAVAHSRKDAEAIGWKCFHCGEVFTTKLDGLKHFGSSERQDPACTIDVLQYRAMEALVERYVDEDTDLHRSMYKMSSDHETALRREEEAGYARGLADGQRLSVKESCYSPTPARQEDQRKDAEPAAFLVTRHADLFATCDKHYAENCGADSVELLYTSPHPQEADKLLQQALEALEYRLQQTRPIHQADVVMESIRTYLEIKNA